MTATTLFYLLIAIVVFSFLLDAFIDYLNAKRFNHEIPNELKDIYNSEEYKKSQKYKKVNSRFSTINALFSLFITLTFFYLDGFKYVDELARSLSSNNTIITLIFFGIMVFGLDIVSLPFSYYRTFIIEERFGFNKTSLKTFALDKCKGWLMTIFLGGGILSLIVWFYDSTGTNFWIYTWILVAVFSIFMNMFYSKLIVPLFNKQTPLEEGELKSEIEAYSKKVGFTLNNIFVIDGSKRSTKANAYFSGFGKQKRITLFDTLIEELTNEEIIAVLAHEVGHYKRKHILFNLTSSLLVTGLTLFILSLLIQSPLLSEALNVSEPSFHIGLIVFGILYSPISELTGILMNILSRKFEYQADDFAKETYAAEPLVNALKKLSKKSLSNLTPHPAYVFINYSHPTLLQRKQNLES